MNNSLRIFVGSLFAIIVLTVLVAMLKSTTLLWVAYAWSLFAILSFTMSVFYWSNSNRKDYILRTAYPLIVKSYSLITMGIAVFFVLFEILHIFSLPWGWFCLFELAVMAFFVWQILAVDAGREAIEEVDAYVANNTVSWYLITAEITAIADRAPASVAANIRKTMEAVRYADPMRIAELQMLDESIYNDILLLGSAVDSNDFIATENTCLQINQKIRERANKMLILKR